MKTIFIAGASAGLGKATAYLFHAWGWRVIATMRTPNKAYIPAKMRSSTSTPDSLPRVQELLATRRLSGAEVAYQLGFEHTQFFNKLFKRKSQSTPMEFQQSLN